MAADRRPSRRGRIQRAIVDNRIPGGCRTINTIISWELVILAAIYFWFVISDQVPLIGWLLLGLPWVVRWIVQGELVKRTVLDAPIYGILTMIPIGLYASVTRSLSLPKVYGILLGVAVFYAVVNRIRSMHDFRASTVGLVFGGIAISILGLIGTNWLQEVIALPWIYQNLPQLIGGVPRSLYGGFSPNGIAGTLTFIMPLLLSLVLVELPRRPAAIIDIVAGRPWHNLWRAALSFALLISVVTLILTQSRGAVLGITVGVLALVSWYDRRFVWILLLISFLLLVLIGELGSQGFSNAISAIDPTGLTIPLRIELWQRGVWMVQDFPYTGIGIANLDLMTNTWYPLALQPPGARVTHTHNNLLQVAVDFGIPGLVAYVALMTTFASAAWRAYRWLPDPTVRTLIVGLVCGMLAHQIFGLTDAFQLGTKPGVVMWGIMGVVAALDVHRSRLRQEILSSGEYDTTQCHWRFPP